MVVGVDVVTDNVGETLGQQRVKEYPLPEPGFANISGARNIRQFHHQSRHRRRSVELAETDFLGRARASHRRSLRQSSRPQAVFRHRHRARPSRRFRTDRAFRSAQRFCPILGVCAQELACCSGWRPATFLLVLTGHLRRQSRLATDAPAPELDVRSGLERARFAVGGALKAFNEEPRLLWPNISNARRALLELPNDGNLDVGAIERAYDALAGGRESDLYAAYSELARAEERLCSETA